MFDKKQTLAIILTAAIFLISVAGRIHTQATTVLTSENIEAELELVEFIALERIGVVMDVWVTAYSSTPDETDETPFITASGERVRDGIVATNFLPFDTEIQIPEFFGDKIFIVKDRMHRRKEGFVDIWMPSKQLAKNFGIHTTEIVILNFEDEMIMSVATNF